MTNLLKALTAMIALLAVSACQADDEGAAILPVAMTEEAVGHYCQMYVLDHGGPKAQIHLKGMEQPLWFSQVSDAVAYLNDQERTADIVAVFVSDMARAASWSDPGSENWTDGRTAFYVTNSGQMGGMGTPEAIPFAERQAAEEFVAREGGIIVSLDQIPDAYVRPKPGIGTDGAPVTPHGTPEDMRGS